MLQFYTPLVKHTFTINPSFQGEIFAHDYIAGTCICGWHRKTVANGCKHTVYKQNIITPINLLVIGK